jgi:hypothetical protein
MPKILAWLNFGYLLLMSHSASQNVKRNYAFVIAAGICSGTTGTTQALGPDGISSLSIGSARLLVGAVFLYLYIKIAKIPSASIPKLAMWLSALRNTFLSINIFLSG